MQEFRGGEVDEIDCVARFLRRGVAAENVTFVNLPVTFVTFGTRSGEVEDERGRIFTNVRTDDELACAWGMRMVAVVLPAHLAG